MIYGSQCFYLDTVNWELCIEKLQLGNDPSNLACYNILPICTKHTCILHIIAREMSQDKSCVLELVLWFVDLSK